MAKKAKSKKAAKKVEINPHGFGAPGTSKPHGKPFTASQLESVLNSDEEGDGDETGKACPRCHKHKPITEFGLRRMKNAKGEVTIRRQSYCFACRAAHGKKMKEIRA